MMSGVLCVYKTSFWQGRVQGNGPGLWLLGWQEATNRAPKAQLGPF